MTRMIYTLLICLTFQLRTTTFWFQNILQKLIILTFGGVLIAVFSIMYYK